MLISQQRLGEALGLMMTPSYFFLLSYSCDERFSGYGVNKQACIFELFLSGVSLYVLPQDFIIHTTHNASIDLELRTSEVRARPSRNPVLPAAGETLLHTRLSFY